MSGEAKAYAQAMRAGDLDTCIRIEQRHDLFGYPPEIVSIGLAAFDRGESIEGAIYAYLDGGHS